MTGISNESVVKRHEHANRLRGAEQSPMILDVFRIYLKQSSQHLDAVLILATVTKTWYA